MDALEQVLNAGGSGPARRNSRVAAINNRSSGALTLSSKAPQTTKNRSVSMLDDIAEQIAKAEQDNTNAKYDSQSSGGDYSSDGAGEGGIDILEVI